MQSFVNKNSKSLLKIVIKRQQEQQAKKNNDNKIDFKQ